MKHTLKKSSDTQVHVTVELDKNDLAVAKRAAVQQLSDSVKVPGFRKGKVPANVAEKHLDPLALANATTENAMNIALNDIAMSEELRILDRPDVDLKDFQPYESLTFEATIAIVPEITLGDYKKLSVKKEKVQVTDAEVDEVVERMRTQLSEKKSVEREASSGDEVNIDFVGRPLMAEPPKATTSSSAQTALSPASKKRSSVTRSAKSLTFHSNSQMTTTLSTSKVPKSYSK
jgi:trigger factor